MKEKRCKKCGMVVDKSWTYCPNCSKPLKISVAKVLAFSLLSLFVVSIIYMFALDDFIASKNTPSEKKINKILSKKYGEDFDEISLYGEVANKDEVMGCDGSYCVVKKGKGETVYYKVHSKKNDIDFFAKYDNNSRSKEVKDNYDLRLKKREVMLSNYDLVNDMATHDIVKGYVGDTSQNPPKEFSSKEDLYNKLSILKDYSETDKSYITQSFNDGAVTLTFYIDDNSKEFCKNNYDKIMSMFANLCDSEEKMVVRMEIKFSNEDCRINFWNEEIYVYNTSYSQGAITLDEYINK